MININKGRDKFISPTPIENPYLLQSKTKKKKRETCDQKGRVIVFTNYSPAKKSVESQMNDDMSKTSNSKTMFDIDDYTD